MGQHMIIKHVRLRQWSVSHFPPLDTHALASRRSTLLCNRYAMYQHPCHPSRSHLALARAVGHCAALRAFLQLKGYPSGGDPQALQVWAGCCPAACDRLPTAAASADIVEHWLWL